MKISELVKGDRVLLSYGDQSGDIVTCSSLRRAFFIDGYTPWQAEVVAKPRGKDPSVVCLKVFGWDTNIGDVYATKIIAVQRGPDWIPVEFTPKQLQFALQLDAMGF